MYFSKFYTLFKACTESEIAGFHKLLRHRHERKEDLHHLLAYIRAAHGTPDDKKSLELSYAYHKIYRQEIGRNRKAFLNTLSELHLLLKAYLVEERIKIDTLENRLLWLTILHEKGLEEAFDREALKYLADLEGRSKSSLADYLAHLNLQFQYYYTFTNTSALDGFAQIQKTAQALEQFNHALKLRMRLEVLHLKNLLPLEFKAEAFIKALGLPDIEPSNDQPIPYLYRAMGNLLESEDFTEFDTLAEDIAENANRISPQELEEMLLFLESILSSINRRREVGEDNLRAHRLNKIALEHKIFTKQAEMQIARFLNVVGIACKAKDFAWIKLFVDSCAQLLPVLHRADTIQLANALIYFEKKEYRDILKTSNEIHSKDIYIQIRIKPFKLIAYYELQPPDIDMEDQCIHFELYLKRNVKSLDEVIKSMINFTNILKMLVRKNAPKQKIREQINTTGLLSFRPWLLEKVENYEQIS